MIIPDSFEYFNERKEEIREDTITSSVPLNVEIYSINNSDNELKGERSEDANIVSAPLNVEIDSVINSDSLEKIHDVNEHSAPLSIDSCSFVIPASFE